MTTSDVHAWCVDAMPAWLDGALAPDDAARLTSHIGQCTECRDELEFARRVRTRFEREWRAVAPLLDAGREQAQFDALWAKITTGEATQPTPAARRQAPMWAALAATLLFATGVVWYRDATTPDFRTLADRPPQRCTALRVQLNAPPTDAVRRALQSTGATIVDGVSAGDTVVLTAANPVDALLALRALPDVRLAEPIDC
jgi:anti-sigma factor RsiW